MSTTIIEAAIDNLRDLNEIRTTLEVIDSDEYDIPLDSIYKGDFRDLGDLGNGSLLDTNRKEPPVVDEELAQGDSTSYSWRPQNISNVYIREVTANTLEPEESRNLMAAPDEDDQNYPEGGLQAWLVVLGSFLGLTAVFGMFNSIGAVQAYIEHNQLESHSTSQVSWIFSVYIFLSYMLSVQVGPLFDAFGPKYLCIIGTIIHVGCLMLVSICTKYYQFLLAFGVGCGIGSSMLFTPLVAIIGHWFNRKRGTATGIATIGGSLGGLVFPLMLRSLYSSMGFGWAIRILAFVSLVVLVLCILLVKPRLPPTDFANIKPRDMVDFSSFKEKRFTFLTIAVTLGDLGLSTSMAYVTSYALDNGMSETSAYTVLTVINGAGIFGRWISGLIADRFGRFNTVITSLILCCVTILVIWLPFGKNEVALFVFAALYGFICAVVLSLIPVCCGQISRTKDYGKRYGTMYFVVSFGVLLGLPVAGALIQSQNYNYLVAFIGALYGLSGLFLLASRWAYVGSRWVRV